MKKYIFILLVFCFSTTHASVIIDPTLGRSGTFSWWTGLGPIDGINSKRETEWIIDAVVDSTMSLVAVKDRAFVGDEFEFVFDGIVVAWSNTFYDTSGFFHGEMSTLFLSAGTHTFSINLTALAPGWTMGCADYSFSGLVPATTPSVPEPTSLALLGLGLAGFGFSRKKKKI